MEQTFSLLLFDVCVSSSDENINLINKIIKNWRKDRNYYQLFERFKYIYLRQNLLNFVKASPEVKNVDIPALKPFKFVFVCLFMNGVLNRDSCLYREFSYSLSELISIGIWAYFNSINYMTWSRLLQLAPQKLDKSTSLYGQKLSYARQGPNIKNVIHYFM